ncbi:hypothetical protein TNCV_4389181 [Trichonephila clavipes]|nr:hypothetical protein TNCV_4389181 [Trichonephila clavipes]
MIVYGIRPRHMDNDHHIIIQSYHFCHFTCSLKFTVLRIMILLRQSRERSEARTKDEALGPDPVDLCQQGPGVANLFGKSATSNFPKY